MAESLPFRFAPPAHGRVDVLIVAGEHSGDQHAARVVETLLERHPEWTVAALGGPELQRAGAQLLFDLTASSVVGLVEVLKNYSFFRSLFAEAIRWIGEYQPRAVVFVDYPGFNLRLAAALRERGLSVKGGGGIHCLFYISPQIWAWKAKRRFTMARDLDGLAVIFPFEVDCYRDTELPVTFVGHPFLEPGHRAPVNYQPDAPVLLLPGSRRQAVGRIFPVLLAGFRASGLHRARVIYPSDAIRAVLESFNPPRTVELIAGGKPVDASAVLTSSGTMSMECALAAIPGAVVYRANPITYLLGRMLVKVPYLGIANLLLKEPMYPEYIQQAATPNALAAELQQCLENPDRLRATREQAERLRTVLRQAAGIDPAGWIAQHLE